VESIETGITYYKKGKFDAALAVFNQLIKVNGEIPEYLHYRARIQSRRGALDESLIDFDKLLSFDAYNTTFISDRAVVLHLLKRNNEAMEAFDQALNLDPNNPYRYSSRAYFKDRIGDLKGAILDYEKAIELDPEDAVSHNNKGMVEEKLGYQEQSRQSLSEADRITGYKAPENIDIPLSKPDESEQNPSNESNQEKAGISFSGFLKVLKGIFTNESTRAEFTTFLKSKFKGS
jgi:tetratricopeptide (TPR) repeat protein